MKEPISPSRKSLGHPKGSLDEHLKLGATKVSDRKHSGDALPQGAFRNTPITDEDAYYAEQEKINLELLKKQREERADSERHCLVAACNGKVMDRVMVDSVEIDKCAQCGGVWLDPGELELLLNRSKGSKNALMRFFHGLAGHYDE